MNSYFEDVFRDNAHSAEECGIPLHIFYNRLEYGFDVESAKKHSAPTWSLLDIVINGVNYSGYAQVADNFNIPYVTMARCLNDMWEIEDIVQYANCIDKGVVYKGKWYPNTIELAEEYNISYEEFCKQKANSRITKLHQILKDN